jgi:hypothetical protein
MLKPNQYPKIRNIYILLLSLSWSAYAYSKGGLASLDTVRYSRWADTLIKHDFNIFRFAEISIDYFIPLHFYYNWITIVAFSKLLIGDSWGLGIVVLNLTAGVFVATLLFKTVWTTTGKPSCAIFAGLLLLVTHEFFLWIPFPLSDILFSSICFSLFILITSLYQQPSECLKRVIGIMILICYAIFFRPSWPPLLVFAILSIPLFFINLKATDSNERHNFIIRCSLLAGIFIPLIIFFHSYFMQHPDKWPFPFLGRTISYLSNDYQQGIVIWEHLETYHSLPGNILEYAFISFHKLFAFFYISVNSYSFIHSLINYIFFLPVYGLSIWAVIRLFKKENGPSPSNWWTIFSCTLFIFLFAFFHALEQIDYDFRYRLPCILPLILLAALGLNELINGFSKRA